MAKEDQEKQSAWGGVSGSRMAWGEWREQDGWGVPKRERMYRKGCRPGVSRLVEGFLDVFDLWQSVPCWTPASKFASRDQWWRRSRDPCMGQVYSQSSGCDLYEEEQGFWGVWEQPSMRSSRLVSRSPFPAQGSSGDTQHLAR